MSVSGSKINEFATAFDGSVAKMNTGYSQWANSMAKIMSVDYEQMNITVSLLTGTNNELEGNPIPIVFPGAGKRHFLGALPEVGDFALISFVSQNSGGQAMAKMPMCIAWFAAPWWMGRDWVPFQDVEPEIGLQSHEQRLRFEGVIARTRLKLRGMEPGHIVASSSQGSDLVLDESVTLANRRGNQIVLRDQDQSIVIRSVNEFHALCGARVYAGMVQRDSKLLPPELFSDGVDWETNKQTALIEGTIDSPYAKGMLTPGQVFQKEDNEEDSNWGKDTDNLPFDPHIDPYEFLSWGAFCSESGHRIRSLFDGKESIYGGKSFFRVGLNDFGAKSKPKEIINTGSESGKQALAEYRIEVSHTTDGTLPVTEQTDGFDADRLPADSEGTNKNPNRPFIEIVHGSVVGNDAWGEPELYGLPMVPSLLNKESGVVSPSLGSGLGMSVGEHAAFLYRMKPISGGEPTWISINKKGKAFACFTGGLDIHTAGDFNLSTANLNLKPNNLKFDCPGDSDSPFAIELRSESNAIKIYAGGKTNEGLQTSRQEDGGSAESLQPNLHLEGKENILIKAQKSVQIHAAQLDLSKTKQIILNTQSALELASGDKMSNTAATMEQTSNKSFTQTAGGGSPLDGPAYKLVTPTMPPTGGVGQAQIEIKQMVGGTKHNINLGNHDTSIQLGNHTTSVQGLGLVQTKVNLGINQTTLSPAGLSTVVGSGVSSTMASGAVSNTGGGAVSNIAGGVNTLRGASIIVGAPGGASAPGPIITGGTRCPITGIPFVATTNCNYGVVTTP